MKTDPDFQADYRTINSQIKIWMTPDSFSPADGFGFGDPDYPGPEDPEYDAVCQCENLKKKPPCPSPPKTPLDPTTNYVSGPGIFMRYLLYAYNNCPDLKKYIERPEYLAFLKANADAIAYDTYSCSCMSTTDSKNPDPGAYACNLSCQITRLATLNAAMVILKSK